MKLRNWLLLTALGAQFAFPTTGMAQSGELSGDISSVTSKALVLDGMTYRFQRNNLEEIRPKPTEQCVVLPQNLNCEELYGVSQKFKARLKLNSAGRVIKVEILGGLQ